MIFMALGSNLPGRSGDSRATIKAAFAALDRPPVKLVARSRLWRTAPVPISDQPWFVNAVARVETALPPEALLAHLHGIEAAFGRERHEVNAARVLDLDLLDYDGQLCDSAPILPHPRMEGRAFVLLPLRDVAPGWAHPVTGEALDHMCARLPADQICEPLA